ncbi:sulfatase-like hydrolase/transferase [Carboxylicivirga sp. A043]|uniref:sulfatase family protein n=1 Tax=Carboxylicivirga litoralis TaxID=2816963 RepID=UPI0021CB9930|nr:sulfatase-like hydrolase/transferase [Carboxylicivirga sp. A043]MCU4157142.1 sulfatase-like hydrolase/transferase [Carboxylicivirga sp. A043]
MMTNKVKVLCKLVLITTIMLAIIPIGTAQNKRPNIVVIMTDQQTANAMSCAGNTDLKTPAMDLLAANGTRFTKAFCSQPLCGPSRSSMLTGQYPHQLDASVNLPERSGYWKAKNVDLMGKVFLNSGYNTGYIGKWHLPISIHDIDKHGFELITNTVERDWQDASIPADCYEFIKKQNDEKPFLMVASFINPHDICEWARKQSLRMEPISDAPAPSECPEVPANYVIPEGQPDILDYVQSLSWKTYPTNDWNKDNWRQYRWAYYQLVERVDAYVGNVIHTLDKLKVLDNTVIIFLSDHGDGVGSHQWNQKQVLYQESVNVPFIVSDFRNKQNGTNTRQLVNIGLDLIPTMCDYAGIQQPLSMKGQSQKKFALNPDLYDDKKMLVLETSFANGTNTSGVSGRCIIKDDWKYIIYNKGKKRDQLFNLADDPGEMNDMTEDMSKRKIKKELVSLLKEWGENTNDELVKDLF